MTDLLLHASHTHLYRGARGRIAGAWRDGPCLVEFSDGNGVPARLDGDVLQVAAHRTAAGARIGVKRWVLERTEEGFRVSGRAG